MNRISEEEAREKLWSVLKQSRWNVKGEPPVGQLIGMATYAVSLEETVSWCPVCDRESQLCICDDEEAKKRERERQMTNLSEEEKQRMREAILDRIRDQLSEKELEEIRRKQKAQEDMEHCPLCGTQRVKDLIYITEDGTIVGCKLCLDNPEEAVRE